jgi:hypothetical protein
MGDERADARSTPVRERPRERCTGVVGMYGAGMGRERERRGCCSPELAEVKQSLDRRLLYTSWVSLCPALQLHQ